MFGETDTIAGFAPAVPQRVLRMGPVNGRDLFRVFRGQSLEVIVIRSVVLILQCNPVSIINIQQMNT